MCVMSPSVTKIEHRKIEPITKHLFPLQDKSIKLAKQNRNIKEEIRGYDNQVWIWMQIDLKIKANKNRLQMQIYEKEDPGAIGFTSGFSREKIANGG